MISISHCEFSIYMLQHFSTRCIWSMLFQTSGSYLDFRDRGLLLINKYWTKCSWWLGWRDHFKSFTVVIMTWLTIKEYLSYEWPLLCFPISWFIIGFITRVTLEEQGLVPSILPLVLSGDCDAQSFVFCVVLCWQWFVIVVFFFIWPWYCVSFHLLFLLISSNFS